jgi:DNA end-binding protein Ku
MSGATVTPAKSRCGLMRTPGWFVIVAVMTLVAACHQRPSASAPVRRPEPNATAPRDWGRPRSPMAPRLRAPVSMAARALWKGTITFGLVSVPIGLISAIEAREELAFNLLHKKDGSRIVQKRFCKEEDVAVPWSDVVKGYQYAKDEYVVLTDEDFEKARVPATQMFEIRKFVPAAEVEDLYFDHPYYVQPEGRGATKPYALLRDALAEAKQIAIGTLVLRQREHLGGLEAIGDAMVLTTMRFAHEIRAQKELDLPGKSWTDREMKLARQLMETLTGDWDPTEYRDTYTEVLRQVIEAKVEGKQIVTPEMPKRPRVANLMRALEQSLKDGPRELAKAEGRRRAASRKAGRTKRKAA